MPRMFNPPHPGLTLRDDVLPALGLTVTEAAAQLGVSRVALSRVLNGRAGISPEMALRIEAWLGVARETSSCAAACVTVSPRAGKTSSRSVKPGCGGLNIRAIKISPVQW